MCTFNVTSLLHCWDSFYYKDEFFFSFSLRVYYCQWQLYPHILDLVWPYFELFLSHHIQTLLSNLSFVLSSSLCAVILNKLKKSDRLGFGFSSLLNLKSDRFPPENWDASWFAYFYFDPIFFLACLSELADCLYTVISEYKYTLWQVENPSLLLLSIHNWPQCPNDATVDVRGQIMCNLICFLPFFRGLFSSHTNTLAKYLAVEPTLFFICYDKFNRGYK